MSLDPTDFAAEIQTYIQSQESSLTTQTSAQITDASQSPQQQLAQLSSRSQRTTVTINYNNSNSTFEIVNASPTAIKTGFNIQSGILELTRKNVIYRETDDGQFEPPLVVGTYRLTINRSQSLPRPRSGPGLTPLREIPRGENQNSVTFYCYDKQPINVPLDNNGRVFFNHVNFFVDKNRWEKIFLVNETKAELTRIERNITNITSEKGTEYGILYIYNNENRQYIQSLKTTYIIMPDDTGVKSLSDVSMANAIVPWIVFLKMFFVLSRINEEFTLQNDIKDYKFLICPGSLKSSLFQMAVSINEFLKLQIFMTNDFFTAETNVNHYETSVEYLVKMKSEVNDFIEALSEHLRKNEQTEATVALITKLRETNHQDKKIQDKQDEYKNGKTVEELNGMNTSTIFIDSTKQDDCMKKIVAQRTILTFILEIVNEMTSSEHFNIPKILDLLKLLKELICTEIGHFLHADAVAKFNDPEFVNGLCDIKTHYKNVFTMWKLIGTAFPLFINFDHDTSDWNILKEEILNIQRMAEAIFHNIVYNDNETRNDSD